jgi:pimeloyl-ACP methyl ester carboxylesterase
MTFYTDTQTALHYTCAGEGPDVLLIHGWASSGRMWQRLLRDLGHAARFWAVDLYGFGQSARPRGDEPVLIDRHRDMLLQFCEIHTIRPRAVIGHSMGGMLALKMAIARADMLERLVLIAPVVTGRFGYPLDLNKLVVSDWGSFALSKSKPFWLLTQMVISPLFSRSSHWYLNDEAADRILKDFQQASWQASAYALQSIARENLEPCLSTIQHPALVIVGQQDFTVPPDEARFAAAQLPNARFLELSSTYHQPLDEKPEQVVAAIHEFIR